MRKDNQAAPDLTIEWLRGELVALLADARGGEKVDHAACAKYADLLFRMLPKQSKEARDVDRDAMAEARRLVLDGVRKEGSSS